VTAIVIRAACARWRTRASPAHSAKKALRQRPTTLSQAWSRPIGNVVIGSGLALIAQLRFATSFRRSAIAAFMQFLRRLVVPFRASAYWHDRDGIAPHAQTRRERNKPLRHVVSIPAPLG